MSFQEQEISIYRGSPVELYTVAYGFNRWYYTSGDEDVKVDPIVYRAVPIQRSSLEVSTDQSTADFTVEFPLDAEFLSLFRISPPSGVVTILCERFHRTDTGAERSIVFKGAIANVAWSSENVEMTCESSSQTIKQVGLRRHYQYGCPHMLYGGECGVNRANFQVDGTASNINGIQIDVTAAANYEDEWFAGGYIEFTHSSLGTVERIGIAASLQGSGRLTLFTYPVGLASGAEVKLFAGCDRTFGTCVTKFGNGPAYGGQPFTPTKNPFDGTPLY
jgi:uncharacterized phage protein (TIGR02218 family)